MKRSISWLVVLAVGCEVPDVPYHDDNSVLDLSSALLVKTRDRLRVCMQVDPALDAESLAATLRDDLAYLRQHPDWAPAGLDHGGVEVAIGCPGTRLVDTAIDGKGAGGALVGPGLTTAPSPYRVHLHVLGDARAVGVLGDQPFARAIAELATVDEHRVAEVSTALVVRASSLGSDSFRNLALAQCLGLRTEIQP
jgi:hypothetical protein